jgi:hypothetical protein
VERLPDAQEALALALRRRRSPKRAAPYATPRAFPTEEFFVLVAWESSLAAARWFRWEEC